MEEDFKVLSEAVYDGLTRATEDGSLECEAVNIKETEFSDRGATFTVPIGDRIYCVTIREARG